MGDQKVPMFAKERKQQIIELVNRKNKVSVQELCETFSMSVGTIRNDLKELEKLDLLSRTHGGAISISKIGFERITSEKLVKHQREKKAIARVAAELVEDGDTIAIDTGTTTMEFVRLLNKKRNLTVVTNDLAIAVLIEDFPHTTVMFIGGIIRKGFHCALGPQSISMLKEIRVDKTFLAGNGIHVKSGITTPDVDTAQLKKELIGIAEKVYFLCDSSKINRAGFIQVAQLDQIDMLITDGLISEQETSEFELAGLNVRIAPLEKAEAQ